MHEHVVSSSTLRAHAQATFIIATHLLLKAGGRTAAEIMLQRT